MDSTLQTYKVKNEDRTLENISNDTHVFMVMGSKFEIDKRYEIIDPVGTGAYGVVVAARDLNSAD